MSKHPVSLKTIAQALNVSMSTVSRALHNHPNVRPVVVQRVQQMARELNYSPNPLAMALLSSQTRAIGVIVPDLDAFFFVHHQWHRARGQRKWLLHRDSFQL